MWAYVLEGILLGSYVVVSLMGFWAGRWWEHRKMKKNMMAFGNQVGKGYFFVPDERLHLLYQEHDETPETETD